MGESDLDARGVERTLKDLFAGAVGGAAQVLLGQYNYNHVRYWKNPIILFYLDPNSLIFQSFKLSHLTLA